MAHINDHMPVSMCRLLVVIGTGQVVEAETQSEGSQPANHPKLRLSPIQ
jgi:hypothetical protein